MFIRTLPSLVLAATLICAPGHAYLWKFCPQILIKPLIRMGMVAPKKLSTLSQEAARNLLTRLERAAVRGAKRALIGDFAQALEILQSPKVFGVDSGLYLGTAKLPPLTVDILTFWKGRTHSFRYDETWGEVPNAKSLTFDRVPNPQKVDVDQLRFLVALEINLKLQQQICRRLNGYWISDFFESPPGIAFIHHEGSLAEDKAEVREKLSLIDRNAKLRELLGEHLPSYVTETWTYPQLLKAERIRHTVRLIPKDFTSPQMREFAQNLGGLIQELELQDPNHTRAIRERIENLLAQAAYRWKLSGGYHIKALQVGSTNDLPEGIAFAENIFKHGLPIEIQDDGEMSPPNHTLIVFNKSDAQNFLWLNCFEPELDSIAGITKIRKVAIQDLIHRYQRVEQNMLDRANGILPSKK